MKKDLDMKLYNEYLSGEKDAFEILYNKYKDKIRYFVYNIVKDYQKAEDITQEVFIYMLQNKFKKDCSFKRYLYIVAKSRAINYINMENNKVQIEEKYFSKEGNALEQDVLEIVTRNETQKELIEAIDMLDDRYRNALYLIKIEEFSYKETAEILGESVQNVKNLVHRGKKELRIILAKKGFDDMNKVLKVIIIVLCIGIILAGGTYATLKIVENYTGKAKLTPTYTSKIGETDTNKVWIGTFNLVWNDFMNDVVGGNIEFEDGESELANELNKQTFKANQLSDKSYFKIHGEASLDLKNKIENGIEEKFNENSKFLDRIDWNDPNGYVLYAILKKEFEFLEPFSTAMGSISFNNSDTRVKCFGVDSNTGLEAGKNVTVLFYNSEDDFAIRLKTKEGEEVILYKTSGEGKSFEENYQECLNKGTTCGNERVFGAKDFLRIPFIKIQDEINYDELCGKYIKNSNYYIKQALQTVDFELNNVGGSVKSEAVIAVTQEAANEPERMMVFDSDFILYLKEESKEQPYFALKVDDISVLVPDEVDENILEIPENTTVTTTIDNNVSNNEKKQNTSRNIKGDNISNNNVNSNNENNDIPKQEEQIDGQEAILPVVITEKEAENGGIITFTGTIEKVTEECVYINPNNDDERIAGNKILIKNDSSKELKEGQKVQVSFKGNITKTYPQNIDLVDIKILD